MHLYLFIAPFFDQKSNAAGIIRTVLIISGCTAVNTYGQELLSVALSELSSRFRHKLFTNYAEHLFEFIDISRFESLLDPLADKMDVVEYHAVFLEVSVRRLYTEFSFVPLSADAADIAPFLELVKTVCRVGSRQLGIS